MNIQGTIGSPSLLALPTEIRQLILHKLLHRPECDGQLPRFLSDVVPSLCPAILRTCRLIYAEALPYFYNSTVHLEVRRKASPFRGVTGGDAYACRVIYLGRTFSCDKLPQAIRERTTKCNVQIWAHRSDDFYRMDHIQAQMRDVAQSLKNRPNWTIVSLRACTFYDSPLCDAENLWPLKVQPLLPLSYIRNRESFTCYGADEAFTEMLIEAATSTEAVIDLDEMYDAFETLVRSTLPPPLKPGMRRTETEFLIIRAAQEGERLLNQLRDRCGPPRDRGDLRDFLTERGILVRKMRDSLTERQRKSALPVTLPDPSKVLAALEAMIEDEQDARYAMHTSRLRHVRSI
jgi:hypothetical protein